MGLRENRLQKGPIFISRLTEAFCDYGWNGSPLSWESLRLLPFFDSTDKRRNFTRNSGRSYFELAEQRQGEASIRGNGHFQPDPTEVCNFNSSIRIAKEIDRLHRPMQQSKPTRNSRRHFAVWIHDAGITDNRSTREPSLSVLCIHWGGRVFSPIQKS
jgi:hypothetical protein